jgi:hypothetical protein
MTKQKPQQPRESALHSWSVYHIKGTPAKLVGIIDDAPDEQALLLERSRNIRCPQMSAAG